MALTAQDLGSMARLASLAADPKGARRDDIFLAIASLYKSQATNLSERERSLMREILQRLLGDVEMAIRINLAERLAQDDSAPRELLLLLADDRIEVARPVILRSRVLSDTDLAALVRRAGEAHQSACAERPYIGETVCAALTEIGSEPVLVVLLRNLSARIDVPTFESLVEKSKRMVALRGPLAERKDLPQDLADRLCGWVSEALRAHIRANYPAIAPHAEAALREAVERVQSPQPAPSAANANDTPVSGAAKLIDKLATGGQLKAGFLIRVLNQGQMELFELGFAKLLEIDRSLFHRAVADDLPGPLALACKAIGIDRAVFPTVHKLTRQALGRRVALTPDDHYEIDSIFRNFSKADAAQRLRVVLTGRG